MLLRFDVKKDMYLVEQKYEIVSLHTTQFKHSSAFGMSSVLQRYLELRTSDRFDDPLAYPGFGLGENMIFPKYELKLYFLVEHIF